MPPGAVSGLSGIAGGTVVVGSADVTIDPASARADEIATAAVRAIQAAGYDARVASGTSSADAAQPAPRGLPVSGSCCSPRSA